jgi:(1->4)-alpha-D-glucan 1-alpha-D-glucosylmutase
MAKGVEDTAFYRYLRLSGLNEVGGDPSRFGLPVEEFHAACIEMSEHWPLSMTTLSTHDTKRSEDVRARLVLLSQCPTVWGEAVTRWTALAARHRRPAGPDPVTEQLVWQTLVGAWPIDADRLVAYLTKATREAKVHTSWLTPSPDFEAAVRDFAQAVLADDVITAEVSGFVEQLAPAWQVTALAQKLVQLTMPGVADTYQGCELVDLSLVDPDNRRPVDYARRIALLDVPDGSLDSDKLRLVQAALAVRERLDGYEPLEAVPTTLAYRRGPVAVAVPLRGGAAELELDGYDDVLPDLPVRLLVLRG